MIFREARMDGNAIAIAGVLFLIALMLAGCSTFSTGDADLGATTTIQMIRDPLDQCRFTMVKPGAPQRYHARVEECDAKR